MDDGESHDERDALSLNDADLNGTDPRVPLAYQRTDLARERSRWAAERTLMAWIRTAISMISFGFAIDKVFATLQLQDGPVELERGYHVVGLALVTVGILFLVLASVEHLIILKRLNNRFGRNAAPLNPNFPLPLFGAGVVLLIGIAALLLMVL